mmetsp:Transcript_7750/g.24299  ORF Transcript_7750/g.24299 Transcript_7750/m.24299 type:complete len:105 (-) Transcript_7750:3538-3852(-)
MVEEPKWPPWSILPDDDVCSVCLSRPEQRGRIESCSHLFCYRCIYDWSRVETKCPMCKQRFYWIEREAKEKKEKKKEECVCETRTMKESQSASRCKNQRRTNET